MPATGSRTSSSLTSGSSILGPPARRHGRAAALAVAVATAAAAAAAGLVVVVAAARAAVARPAWRSGPVPVRWGRSPCCVWRPAGRCALPLAALLRCRPPVAGCAVARAAAGPTRGPSRACRPARSGRCRPARARSPRRGMLRSSPLSGARARRLRAGRSLPAVGGGRRWPRAPWRSGLSPRPAKRPRRRRCAWPARRPAGGRSRTSGAAGSATGGRRRTSSPTGRVPAGGRRELAPPGGLDGVSGGTSGAARRPGPAARAAWVGSARLARLGGGGPTAPAWAAPVPRMASSRSALRIRPVPRDAELARRAPVAAGVAAR